MARGVGRSSSCHVFAATPDFYFSFRNPFRWRAGARRDASNLAYFDNYLE
jgi:hypothetical protein